MSSQLKTNFGMEIPIIDGYLHILVFPSPHTTKKVYYKDIDKYRG